MILKYKFIRRKPYCCVPTAITMILDRKKIKHASQDEISYQLGLIVPKEKLNLFSKVRIGRKPAAGYGTQVGKKQYSINNFFKNNKIMLKEEYFPISKLRDVRKFLMDNLKKDNDIIVCFNYRKLYGIGNDGGHVSLVQKVGIKNVVLADPTRDRLKIKKVAITKLKSAIKDHGVKNKAGFWIISAK